MRCIVVLVAVMVTVASPAISAETVVPPVTSANHLDRLPDALEHYSTVDTTVMKWIKEVRVGLPEYSRWAVAAKRAGARGHYRVDVILQRHEFANMTMRQELQVYYSQWRIRQLLDSLQYQVIGLENLFQARITWPGLEQTMFHEIRDHYGPDAEIDSTNCRLVVLRSMWRMNGLIYFLQRPQAFMIGAEELPLHRLQMAVIRDMNRRPFYLPVDSATVDLFWALARSRSELVVVKTIRAMTERHQTRGVVIIGLGHEPEMPGILKKYGLHSTIYSTELPDRLPPDWWK